MRVVFVGKGGAGKSAIAGTFARLLARTGEPVLALDVDTMPGLAFSLGVDQSVGSVPADAMEERGEDEEGPPLRLRAGLDVAAAVERYAARGPDGVRVLTLGKLRRESSELRPAQFALRQIIAEIDGAWSLVGDLAAGTRQAFFGWGDFARTVLVVVEPSAKSVLSARRLARLATVEDPPRVVAVANKVRTGEDIEQLAVRTGLEVIAAVPYDEAMVAADRSGRALLDEAAHASAVEAIDSLLQRLQAEEDSA